MRPTNRALTVGINAYPGNELTGCRNDAEDWARILEPTALVMTLLDKQATKAKIVSGMNEVLHSTQPGSYAIITYSGHGTWVPDENGDEPDGRDECLCPYDMDEEGNNLLVDDEIYQILTSRPEGVRVLFITDSCHSGTVMRLEDETHNLRPRFYPPTWLDHPAHHAELEACTVKKTNDPIPGVVHLAGCSDREYSYDAEFHGRPNGALSYHAMLASVHLGADRSILHWFEKLRKRLPSKEFPQTPKLNATALNRHWTLPW